MDFQSILNDKCSTIKMLEKKLVDYCQLHMERRSVDERLQDFANIMCTALSVNRIYEDDDRSWQVTYKIGPLKVTVRGFDESVCERECKLKMLKKLTCFSMSSDDHWNGTIQNQANVARYDLADRVENDICAANSGGKSESVDNENGGIYEDPEVSVYASSNEPATSVSPQCRTKPSGRLENTAKDDSVPSMKYNDFSRTAVSSQPNDEDRKNHKNGFTVETKREDETIAARKRAETRGDDRSAPGESIAQTPGIPDETETDPPAAATTTFPEETELPVNYKMGSYDQMVSSAMILLDDLSDDTLSATTNLFSILLVAANLTNGSYFELIVKIIVQRAIDAFDEHNSVTARLCSGIVRNMSTDDRPEVRDVISTQFVQHLLNSCTENLWGNTKGQPRVYDIDVHMHSLQTCRFIGQLFMVNESRLNMYPYVSLLVKTFAESLGAFSLECLSTLLTIIGSRFKTMNKSKYKFSLTQVYKSIDRCREQGCTPYNVVLHRRTVAMLEHLRDLQEKQWKRRTAVQGNARKTNVTAGHY